MHGFHLADHDLREADVAFGQIGGDAGRFFRPAHPQAAVRIEPRARTREKAREPRARIRETKNHVERRRAVRAVGDGSTLMMIALLAYDLSSSGTLAWLIPGIANTARMRINYMLLALVAVSALAFLRNFFEQRVMTPWLKRVCVAAAVSVGVPAIGIAVFAPFGLRLFDMLYAFGFLFVLGSIVPILVNAWRRHSAFLPFFTIAWAVPIAFAVVRAASSL